MMKNSISLIEAFIQHHPEEALSEIEALSPQEVSALILQLSIDCQVIVFSRLSNVIISQIILHLSPTDASRMMDDFPLSLSERLLRSSEAQHRQNILSAMPMSKRKLLKRFLTYTPRQVGARLNPLALAMEGHQTIDQALNSLKNNALPQQQNIYVLDATKKLIGYLPIQDMVASEPEQVIRKVMKPISNVVTAAMSIDDVLERWNEAYSELPVTDAGSEFLGTISRQALIGKNKALKKNIDNSAIKAGNALADLYLIGLTSLLGNADQIKKS